MLKAFKYRIYPTSEQSVLLAKSFGCARWFYNYALNLTSETYKQTGKGLSRDEIIKLLPSLKKEYEWLSEVPSQVLQQAALNLSSAFLNFLKVELNILTSRKSKIGSRLDFLNTVS